jgi:hypothetical protein
MTARAAAIAVLLFVATNVNLPAAVDLPPAVMNRVANVAAKSHAWMLQNQTERHYKADVVWIFDVLIRKFGLHEPRAVALFRRDVRDGRFWKSSFSPLLHVLVPEVHYRPDNAQISQGPIDRIVNRAIWCDKLEPDADMHMQMFNLAAKGGYELTHMYLALLILREQACPFYKAHAAELADFEKRWVRTMEQLIENERNISDLHVEAAAFMAYGRQKKVTSSKFLLRFLSEAENHLDNPYVSKMSGHTAVLILWYALEVANPDARQVRLAPRIRS